jgi:xylose dehydrogenase (NAD/NADP)
MDISELSERDWTSTIGDETLRLAVVGYGSFATDFAVPAIRRAEPTELTVVVSRSEPDHLDGCRCIDYESYREGVAQDAYDAVYVSTPNALHVPHAATAADLGKPALVEKPMAATTAGCDRLTGAFDRADVPLMVAYRTQLDPVIRGIKRLVSNGEVGTPKVVTSSFSFSMDTDEAGWRLVEELAGGGALTDVGVYPINTIRYVLDEDPTTVTASIRHPGPPFDSIERSAHVQLEFSQCTALISASFDAAFDSFLRIVGTEGVLELNPAYTSDGDRRLVLTSGDQRTSWAPTYTDELVETFAYFASRVLDDRPVEPDGRDGWTDLRVVAAAYESAELGSPVVLTSGPED